jgi:hypothetical protein
MTKDAGALTLALMLRDRAAHDEGAFARLFVSVHSALAKGRLPAADWDLLSAQLPSAQSWWTWDRCERLRRGTIAHLAASGADLRPIFSLADAQTIAFLTKSCLMTPAGRALLARSIERIPAERRNRK